MDLWETAREQENGWRGSSTREGLAEDTSPIRAQQTIAAPITTQSVFKLVEDIDALREALSCTDLQDSPRELGDLDATEKLREIGVRLLTLQATASEKTEENTADHEKVWSFLEQSIMMEPRNLKRASSPVYNSVSEDTFQFRSLEEDCTLSREEIKRRSIHLIEAHQPKKKAPRGTKKS